MSCLGAERIESVCTCLLDVIECTQIWYSVGVCYLGLFVVCIDLFALICEECDCGLN